MTNKAVQRLEVTAHDIFSGIRPDPAWKVDSQYHDRGIITAEHDGEYYDIKMDDGYHCGFPANKGIAPMPGQKIRLWGDPGLGGVIRGMAIIPASGKPRVGFYRTETQDLVYHMVSALISKLNRYIEVYENTEDQWQRIQDLPEPFRKRLEHFRKIGGVDYLTNEGYELFCCEEAVKIANAFKTPDEIRLFREENLQRQKEMVPHLEYDQHSGNTFGAAIHLAWAWKSEMDAAIYARDDGALGPLVGSYRDEAAHIRQAVEQVIKTLDTPGIGTDQIRGMLKEAIHGEDG